MTASTRCRVSSETSDLPLITFDTVGAETPACAAMCAIVVARRDPLRRVVGIEVMTAVYRKFRLRKRDPSSASRECPADIQFVS